VHTHTSAKKKFLETFRAHTKIIYRVVDVICMYATIHFVFCLRAKRDCTKYFSSLLNILSFIEMKILLHLKIYRRVQIRKLYGRKIIVEAKEIFIECKSFKCLRQAYFALSTHNFLAIFICARRLPFDTVPPHLCMCQIFAIELFSMLCAGVEMNLLSAH
jgi:hypothetical protein